MGVCSRRTPSARYGYVGVVWGPHIDTATDKRNQKKSKKGR